MVNLTTADTSCSAGAQESVSAIRKRWRWLKHLFGDGAYDRTKLLEAVAFRDCTVEIIRRSDDVSGFKVLPRRWVVERNLGWMTRWRRLVRDYEKCPRKAGDIVLIDLGSGRHAHAQVADEPLVISLKAPSTKMLRSSIFPAYLSPSGSGGSSHAITKGTWPFVGSRPLQLEIAKERFFYKQDAISDPLSLYHSSLAATNYERPASLEECQHLECAAVCEPEHVADRLNDHAAHRLNRWVESLRIERSRRDCADG